MQHRLLAVLGLTFIGLVIFQSMLGGVLFGQTIGFSPEKILAHYNNKSFTGLLEVTLPHAIFITIALMATLHFLTFIETIDKKTQTYFTHLLFTLFFLDQTTPFFLMMGITWFAYLKIPLFFGFELMLGWVWIVIFKNILKEIK